ncbi:hypothetical protein J6590_060471, partial [Homalodisca vitripennis]
FAFGLFVFSLVYRSVCSPVPDVPCSQVCPPYYDKCQLRGQSDPDLRRAAPYLQTGPKKPVHVHL